jgi:hypothetical protein
LGSATANAGANILIAGASSKKNWSLGVQQNVNGGLEFTPTATDGALTLGTTPAMVILDNGNVGIGTTAPTEKLDVSGVIKTNTQTSKFLLSTTNTIGATQTIEINNSVGDRRMILGFGTTSSDLMLVSNDRNADMVFRTNATEKVRILAAGGLTFNGDTAAANALDDYEEGTWTIGVSFGGASVGVTYANNTGTYTKIGRQVTVNGYILLTNKGSSTGSARITGLPFTIANSNSNFSTAALWFNAVTFANQFEGYGEKNTTTIALEEITVLGTTTTITNADFANNSSVMVSLTYFV